MAKTKNVNIQKGYNVEIQGKTSPDVNMLESVTLDGLKYKKR